MRIIKVPYLNKNQTIHDLSINSNGEYIAIAEKYVYIYKICNINNDINKVGVFSRNDLINDRTKQIEIKENGFQGGKAKENKEVKENLNNGLFEADEIEKVDDEIDPEEEKQNEIILKQLKDNQLKDLLQNVHILINDNIANIHAVTFLNNSSNVLLSGGMDKSLLIYNLDFDNKKSKALRALNLSSEIAVVKVSKNDNFVLASCFDFNIYVIHLKYDDLNSDLICFEARFKMDNNTSIVQSIFFDPLGSNKFITFAEDKKICLCEIDFHNYNNFHQDSKKIPVSVKILMNIADFESNKHNYPPMKKLSWGINDMVIFPNFSKIKEFCIPHCKIFKFFDLNYNMMNNQMFIDDQQQIKNLKSSNLLIGGNESAILNIVSFYFILQSTSEFKYSYINPYLDKLKKKNNVKSTVKKQDTINSTNHKLDVSNNCTVNSSINEEHFNIMVTIDVNGKAIFWEVKSASNITSNEKTTSFFSVNSIFEINNLSDSCVTCIQWGKEGDTIYFGNITGNVIIVELTEFNIHKVNNYSRLAQSISVNNYDDRRLNQGNVNQININNAHDSQIKKKRIAPTMIDSKMSNNNTTLILNENCGNLGGINQFQQSISNFPNINNNNINNRMINDTRFNQSFSSSIDTNLFTQLLLNLNKSIDALSYLGKKKEKEIENNSVLLQQVDNFNFISIKEEKEFKPINCNINYNKRIINFENYSLPKDLILSVQNFYNSTSKIDMHYGKIPLFVINNNEFILKFAYNSIFFAYYCNHSGLTVKTLFNTTIFNKIKISSVEIMKCIKYHLCLIENDTFKIYNLLSKKLARSIPLSMNADNKIIDFEFIDTSRIYIKYIKTDIKFRKDNTCWLVYNDTINQFTTIQDSICDFDEYFNSKRESDLLNSNQNNQKIIEFFDKDNSFFDENNMEINFKENPYLVYFCNKNFLDLMSTFSIEDKSNVNLTINDSNNKENDKKSKKLSKKDIVYYQKIETITNDLQNHYDRFEFFKSLKLEDKMSEIFDEIIDFFLVNKMISFTALDFLIWIEMTSKFHSEMTYINKEKLQKLADYFQKGKFLDNKKDVSSFVLTISHYLTQNN